MVFPCILLQYGEICAKELKVHEQVLTTDVICVIIKEIQVEQLAKSETTYNFEVKDFHTYYVGEQSVCVHNANCGFGKYKNGMEMTPNEALDAATDFLGEGYKEVSPNRFVSADGVRQVRMSPLDLATVNNHAGGPHLNFDILKPKYKTIHIYIKGL